MIYLSVFIFVVLILFVAYLTKIHNDEYVEMWTKRYYEHYGKYPSNDQLDVYINEILNQQVV